ncbi:MAG TPA: DUF6340 family protein [Bacteroidales bacterium]|nr:DUF6340 family protein [Bacteroidales bacterium]HPF02511.1 DUF6340 family protein [Bacteroidales bacterium]HPJ59041.1 DUF6340 family protein [Bacteroidales bacterium]HPR13229.1 DUF6340 family protein [Bacteroidales bacterium]HRW84731.1 DUF6340 family protein [Bacteroidales bacterium]
MKKLFPLVFAVLFLVSCKTNQLYLSVVEPASVTLSREIKKVGVINRSIPTDETKILDVIDKALSLEGVDLDKDGAEQAIKGLSEELKKNARFDDVKIVTATEFRTPKLGIFPVPLSWEIVDKVCREEGADALFALEYYDTDTRLNYTTSEAGSKEVLGVKLPAVVHQANMETIVKTGWRIYDPVNRVIADEFNHFQSFVFTGTGPNPLVAVAGLIGRKEAITDVSNRAGHSYALRIIPFMNRVYRDYFVKGTDNFKTAKRRARMGQWNEAAELWELETASPKRKVAGRACYNMGIINEINGYPEEALVWVQKAYTDYNIRQARDYARILENRLYKLRILSEQEQ